MQQCPIYFKEECFDYLNEYISSSKISKIFLLVDENTHNLCLPYFLQEAYAISEVEIVEVEPGESNKSLETVYQLYWTLTDLGADRNSLIINLGGGVITDMGGFLAATFKRGLRFINVPTTLLSMVDASVGGKTGVDLGNIKNQVGTFSMAEMVLVVPEFLETLDKRQLLSGFAEMLKHGLIKDKQYWSELTKIGLPNSKNTVEYIQRAIQLKREVVGADPLEAGERKILNFGHTFGHGLESHRLGKSNELLHGEAILVGMYLEAELSEEYCGLPENEKFEIQNFIKSIFPIPNIDSTEISAILELIANDKKNDNSQLNFSLLKKIGKATFNNYVSAESIVLASQKLFG